MLFTFSYATPSVFESQPERALLGLSAHQSRPVRFQGRICRHAFIVRTFLRALGDVIASRFSLDNTGVLDPILTVHPDGLLLEAFSQDQAAFASVWIDRTVFETEGETVFGTTNIDFTAWLRAALGEMRSSRETWFRIGSQGFEVSTVGAGGRFEHKVEVPDTWVRGFLEVQAAMAHPGTRFSTSPAAFLAPVRFLRYEGRRTPSPRALRYEFTPGKSVRAVLEPWEKAFEMVGASHTYEQPRTIRTWGRSRLRLLEPVLPFADRVTVYLKGRALPAFYAVEAPGVVFTLGLTGWTSRQWSDEDGGLSLMARPFKPSERGFHDRVLAHLKAHTMASVSAIASQLEADYRQVLDACTCLCRGGRATFDVRSQSFRHRELFDHPLDETRFFPPNLCETRAEEWIAGDSVRISSICPNEKRKILRIKTPEGPLTREVIHADWEVQGIVGPHPVEVVIGNSGRMIFGKCGCPFFKENLMAKGPCEHLIAAFRVASERLPEKPSSIPLESPDDEATNASESIPRP